MAGLLALMLIGGMKPSELFQTSFGDPLVMMMFFIFVFCATINYYGLSKFILAVFITRKCVRGEAVGCSPIRFSCPSSAAGRTDQRIPGGRHRLEHPVRHL